MTKTVKRYLCIKDYMPSVWLTKGKIYELDEDDNMVFDDGYEDWTDVEVQQFDRGNPLSDFLQEITDDNLLKERKYMTNKRKFEKVSISQWYSSVPDVDGINMLDWDNLHKDIKMPKRGTQLSAGYDIFAPYTFTLEPNQEEKIPTGIRAFMNDDNVLKAYPRSGHGFKYYVRLANTVGVIDADYVNSSNEGHIFVKLRNEGNIPMTINKGEGMCQVIFEQYFLTVDDESEGVRDGGFGSTTK